jgi:hypothetical protein
VTRTAVNRQETAPRSNHPGRSWLCSQFGEAPDEA